MVDACAPQLHAPAVDPQAPAGIHRDGSDAEGCLRAVQLLSDRADLEEQVAKAAEQTAAAQERYDNASGWDQFWNVGGVNDDLETFTEEQERLQAALPTDSTIHTEFAAQGEYEVNADRALLTRALDALLENAVQHTPEGGCITVLLADGVLSVTNTGDAIPADALPRLWEAYYQADPSRSAKGDGLGLSIAKTVFDLHGFTCGAENTEIGPKFWFRFADK